MLVPAGTSLRHLEVCVYLEVICHSDFKDTLLEQKLLHPKSFCLPSLGCCVTHCHVVTTLRAVSVLVFIVLGRVLGRAHLYPTRHRLGHSNCECQVAGSVVGRKAVAPSPAG